MKLNHDKKKKKTLARNKLRIPPNPTEFRAKSYMGIFVRI